MSEERNEFTPDLFTLEDEDGNEQVFELLDVLEYEDNTYYALVPYYGDDEDALARRICHLKDRRSQWGRNAGFHRRRCRI